MTTAPGKKYPGAHSAHGTIHAMCGVRKKICAIVSILLSMGVVVVCGLPVAAQTQTSSGDVTVSSFVTGPPPATAPTIDSPTNNETFREKNISVSGDCIAGLIVKIFRNNTFAGSAICDSHGSYVIRIDLFQGRNDLTARQYDIANQSSPDSNTITVFFAPITPNIPDEEGGSAGPGRPNQGGNKKPPVIANFQLIIDYDYTFQGVFQNKPFELPISFSGGVGPYALSIDWGDSESSLFSRKDTTRFTPSHIYKSAGFKTVVIKVTDSKGETSRIQFVILVNGATSAPVTRQLFGSHILAEQWPLVVIPSVLGGIAVGAIAAAGVTSLILRRRFRRPPGTGM